jgi:hypothetical protein
MHHPLNWFVPDNAKVIRRHIQKATFAFYASRGISPSHHFKLPLVYPERSRRAPPCPAVEVPSCRSLPRLRGRGVPLNDATRRPHPLRSLRTLREPSRTRRDHVVFEVAKSPSPEELASHLTIAPFQTSPRPPTGGLTLPLSRYMALLSIVPTLVQVVATDRGPHDAWYY